MDPGTHGGASEQTHGKVLDESARPIWEVLADLGQSIPDSEWDRVPRDLSENLDHYLYGAPRNDP